MRAVSTVMEDLKLLEDRILARIQELETSVAELEQLREVAARLGILDGDRRDTTATGRATATARPRRAARGQSSGTAVRSGGARSATRPETAIERTSHHGTRRERVLEVVGGEPGISVREVVAQLGVNRTSLYPVVRQLVSDGLLYKDGRGLWLVSP
jgi:hypothetical protein